MELQEDPKTGSDIESLRPSACEHSNASRVHRKFHQNTSELPPRGLAPCVDLFGNGPSRSGLIETLVLASAAVLIAGAAYAQTGAGGSAAPGQSVVPTTPGQQYRTNGPTNDLPGASGYAPVANNPRRQDHRMGPALCGASFEPPRGRFFGVWGAPAQKRPIFIMTMSAMTVFVK